MKRGRQSVGPSSKPAGGPGPSLEDSNLVSGTFGDVQGLPSNHRGKSQPHSANTPTVDARCAPPTSRVEYLRRQYKEQKLSEKAAELMLSSWREKSSETYESQFHKWCSSRGVDPISCPVGEVINFLADLFEQGYQAQSHISTCVCSYETWVAAIHFDRRTAIPNWLFFVGL